MVLLLFQDYNIAVKLLYYSKLNVSSQDWHRPSVMKTIYICTLWELSIEWHAMLHSLMIDCIFVCMSSCITMVMSQDFVWHCYDMLGLNFALTDKRSWWYIPFNSGNLFLCDCIDVLCSFWWMLHYFNATCTQRLKVNCSLIHFRWL